MSDLAILIAIGFSIFIGASSPGPSFLVVSRISISRTLWDGYLSALGMALGGLCYAFASIMGLTGLLLTAPAVFIILKVIGGCYLIYLGVSAWRGSKTTPELSIDTSGSTPSNFKNSFLVSLGTQLSNPKALIVYSGVFATFLPNSPSIELAIGICVVAFLVELGWYLFVVMVLSSKAPRRFYLKYKTLLERIAGTLLGVFGLKLCFSSF